MRFSVVQLFLFQFLTFRHTLGFTTPAPRLFRRPILSVHAKKDVELGIRTAQLLLDPRRRLVLTKDLSARFPLVPASALEPAVSLVGDALQKVAPEQLKQALTPGGLEEIRPVIRDSVVEVALDHPIMEGIPLPEKDKGKMLGNLIDLALDEILKDAEWVLSSPETRLEALETQIHAIHNEMGRRRLFKYRVSKNPIRYTSLFVMAGLAALTIQQGSVGAALGAIQSGLATLWKCAKAIGFHFGLIGRYIGKRLGLATP